MYKYIKFLFNLFDLIYYLTPPPFFQLNDPPHFDKLSWN